MAEDSDPLVDVGIGVYDRPRYVAEAVESVLAQTLDSWRLVVSEDGPGDGPVAAAVEPYLTDPRISYASTGEHVGAAGNMSTLVQGGSAPYVALLHDDDRWDPGFLERRVNFLEANPACGFVFSGNIEIDSAGREAGRSRLVLPQGVHPSEVFVSRLLEHNVVATPTLLVRRSAYEEVGAAFDERFRNIFDYEMCLRLAVRFPVGYLSVRDAAYRVHGQQITGERLPWGDEFLLLLDHADKLLEGKPPGWRLSDRRRRQKRSGWMLSHALDAAEESDRRAALSHLRRALRVYPRSLVDLRTAGVVAGLALGPAGPRLLASARSFVYRRRIALHRGGH